MNHQQQDWIKRYRILQKRLRRWWIENDWLVIGLAAIMVFCLGIVGFKLLYLHKNTPHTLMDLFHMSFQLFRLGTVVPLGPDKPWLLELARTLATAITLLAAIKALMLLFQDKLQKFRLRFWKNHIIICGLGEKGKQLALDLLERGEKVVIIDADEKNDKTRRLTGRGAIVLAGNAANKYLLEKARARYASSLFAVCADDWINLEIALLAQKLMTEEKQDENSWLSWLENQIRDLVSPLSPPMETAELNQYCFVHLINTELCDLLARHRVLHRVSGQVIIKSFNIYENAARRLFRDYPPEVAAAKLNQDTVHILLIGFGQMGRSIALQIARAGHYANGKKVCITVVDKFAEKKRDIFLHNYPNFNKICSLDFISLDTDDKDFLNGSFLDQKGGPTSVTQAIVCLEKESAAHVCALNLLHLFQDTHCQILVRVNVETEMVRLLGAEQSGTTGESNQVLPIHAFGSIANSCSLKMVMNDDIDEKAKQVHAYYFQMKIKNGADPAKDASMKPWEQLTEDLKDSNRQQAEHLDVKLRTVGCKRQEIRGTEPAPFDFTKEEIELLAPMEHARWNAERFLAGWTLGERDPAKKISPFLVGWDELDEIDKDIKEYDRNTIRKLPEMLAFEKIREEIVRVRVSP